MNRVHDWVGRKDRNDVSVDATVLRADGKSIAVTLTNVSDGGCCLRSDEPFRIGEHIGIALPRMGSVRAQVRWALPGAAGAQFLDDGSI